MEGFITSSGELAGRKALAEAMAVRKEACEAALAGNYVAAMGRRNDATSSWSPRILIAQPSPSREARAVWEHSGTGPYPGDWDRTARLLAENGFNMIVTNMLRGGLVHYPSDLLPRSGAVQWGDQLEQCVRAAKKYGLEVHVWKVNYNFGWSTKEFVDRIRREDRAQVTVKGKTIDWLCPSHPENQRLERESMLEAARRYGIDGLHFDYIRYPDRDSCYCEGCRRRFETDSGRAVAHWPEDCYDGLRAEEYNDWRSGRSRRWSPRSARG